MAHFEYSSVVQAKRSDVFKFMSDMNNIKGIMPTDYKIEPSEPFGPIKRGSEYDFRLTRFGISVRWLGVVEECIIDEMVRERQSQGPFSLWVHTHKYEDHGQGTLVTDLIEYDLPFGLLGKLWQDLYARRELERVFHHRHEKLQEILGSGDGSV